MPASFFNQGLRDLRSRTVDPLTAPLRLMVLREGGYTFNATHLTTGSIPLPTPAATSDVLTGRAYAEAFAEFVDAVPTYGRALTADDPAIDVEEGERIDSAVLFVGDSGRLVAHYPFVVRTAFETGFLWGNGLTPTLGPLGNIVCIFESLT